MADMKQWKGVIVTFKDEYDLISWEADPDEKYIETIEYMCYNDYISLSLGELSENQRIYDQVTWSDNGHPLPRYTAFCFICKDMLNIHSEYCCIGHQTKIAPLTRQGLLEIMTEQITNEQVLCSYITIRAILYYDLINQEVNNLLKIGKKNIMQFINTSSGMMLLSILTES